MPVRIGLHSTLDSLKEVYLHVIVCDVVNFSALSSNLTNLTNIYVLI